MDVQTIMLLIGIIGCFVGLAGWLTNREKKVVNDSEWRGNVNGKLDALLGINSRVDKLEDKLEEQGNKITEVIASTKSAHHRLDEHLRKE